MLNITSELIRSRRSVRTFDGRELSAAQRADLCGFMADIPNPWGIPVEFRLLDAKEHGLSSPVLNRAGRVVGVASYLRNCRDNTDWSKTNTRYNGIRRFALRLSGIRWIVPGD